MVSNSKLSIQVADLYQYEDTVAKISAMQPVAVKALIGGEQLLKSVLPPTYNLCPNTWVVVRIPQIEGAFNANNLVIEGPEKMAQRWVNSAMSYAGFFLDKRRTLLEGPFNEFAAWYLSDEFTRFEDSRQRLLYDLGYKSMLCNFGVGAPEPDFWPKFAPALRTAKKLGNAVGLHLYFPVYFTDDWKWFAGRFGFLTDFYKRNPDCRVPIFATEGGIDDCLANNDKRRQEISFGYHTPGWQICETPFRLRGDQRPLDEIYYNELVTLDNVLSTIPEFACYLIYAYQRAGAGWDDFDLKKDGVIDRLIDHVNPLFNGRRLQRATFFDLRLGANPEPTPQPIPVPIPVPRNPPFRGRVKLAVKGLNFRQDANADRSDNIWQVIPGGTEFEIWQSEQYMANRQKEKAGWICVKIQDRIGFLAYSYCELLPSVALSSQV